MVRAKKRSSKDGLKKAVERIKAHPVVFAVITVVAFGAFVAEAADVFGGAADLVSDVFDPHSEEYAALATLDLDVRLEFFEDNFGVAKSVYDVCDVALCPEPEPESLRMYVHETEDMTIRAVFDDEQLVMYAVTTMSSRLSPEMRWLGWDLGDLGKVTFAEAFDAIDTVSGPTDVAVFMGAQAIAYAEVFAGGGPSDYRGLLLAAAPDGYSPAFNTDAGFKLSEAEVQNEKADPAVVADFRSSTVPNTYGEFRDDGGYVGNWLQEASELIPLLFAGTEL